MAQKVLKNLKNNISLFNNLAITKKNPVSLVHFVTNRCNARCSFCFINFDDPLTFKGELDIDEIDKMTKSLGPNLQNVNLTGGEPFARKDFVEIANCYFKNTDIRSIFITSNGSLPDRVENFLKVLSKDYSDRSVMLSFSIDGLPEEHNRIRKIKNLFESTIKCYNIVNNFYPFAQANVAITISHENHQVVPELYETLIEKYGVKSFTIGIVRDEGVYRIPIKHKTAIHKAYKKMTKKVLEDVKSGRLNAWNKQSIQGRMMNEKNSIIYDVIADTYMEPKYITPCMAGSLFGVIEANGKVRPCEILEDSYGNIRDYDYNFMDLWSNKIAKQNRDWIKSSKCNCHYDCAWSFNILGNLKFQKKLILPALGLK